jgi:hypothetical protein
VQARLLAMLSRGLYDSQLGSLSDWLTSAYGRCDREVGRAEAVWMVDGDYALACHGAGEADCALARGQDCGGGGSGKVDAAVAGEPGLRGRREPAEDAGLSFQRPAPGSG